MRAKWWSRVCAAGKKEIFWQKKKQKNCSERSRGRFFLSVNPRWLRTINSSFSLFSNDHMVEGWTNEFFIFTFAPCNKQKENSTRNYNFLKHATQNVAGDMLVSKSGFEPRGTESRRSTTPSHGNMRLRLSSTETLKRVLVVPPTKIRIWT